MSSGIYKISNTQNEKIYIGSSRNVTGRIREHFSRLNKLNHKNSKLMQDYRECGKESFKSEIIEECPVDKLIQREDYWIKELDSMNQNKGYNMKDASQTVFNEEICNKISVKKIESWKNPKYREIRSRQSKEFMNNPIIKKFTSERTKKQWENIKIRNSIIKKLNSVKNKDKMSSIMKEKWKDPIYSSNVRTAVASEESRNKISIKCKERYKDPNYRNKMLNINNSLEMKKKRSENSINMWKDPKFKNEMTIKFQKNARNPERIRKIREAALKRWSNLEWKAKRVDKIREQFKNPETRKKLSLSTRNRWNNPEIREKMILAIKKSKSKI